ncbi:MAG: thioredoxin family protein [Kiritimatiellae bacterium]|nr:thioredoxin family protein [Kiritimatiellia bacterium]
MAWLKRSVVAVVVAVLASSCPALTGFDADYDAARARAKASGRQTLVLFTGSDWCVDCAKFEKNVLSTDAFLDFATNAYELVALDFSMRGPQSAAEKRRNEELAGEFGVSEFPTVLLLDADGKVAYETGYEAGGAEKWVKRFKEGVALQPLFDEHLAAFKARADGLSGKLGEEFSARCRTLGDDMRKMAECLKSLAGEFLPEATRIQKELEAKEVPAELAKAKEKLAGRLAQICAQLGEQAKIDVDEFMVARDKSAARRGRPESWLADWSENLRTNTTIETCASFRDGKLRPFLLAEMDPQGRATDEERKVLDAAVDPLWGGGGLGTFAKRRQLTQILERTAKKPFGEMAKAFAEKKDHVEPVAAWLEAGAFANEAMRAVFWTLRGDVSFAGAKMRDRLEKASVDEWLKLLWRIGAEKAAAWDARGGGFADSVTEEGWDGYARHGDACRAAHRRALELRPSYPEPTYLFAGLGPFPDDLFVSTTARQADFEGFFDSFFWFGCYPRWCGSFEKMKAFAERCYATGRHDTMVPYYYAEALLRMVDDMGVGAEDYFRDHADELDKIIEVSLPQVNGAHAFGEVRQCAGVFATFAFYLKGDRAKAGETWRSFPHETLPRGIWGVIRDFSDRWLVFNGISGRNRVEFQRLDGLYAAGDFAGFVRGLEELRARAQLDKGEEEYATERALQARVRSDLPAGRPVDATFPKDKTTWLTYDGAWRMNGRYAYNDGKKYGPASRLEWAVEIPGEFRLECEIAPDGERDKWQFDATMKPADARLADRGDYPFLSLEFAPGACTASFGEWRDVFEDRTAATFDRPYAGGSVRVVLVYKGGRATAYVGDGEAPVLETEACARVLNRVKAGILQFNGKGARLMSVRVSRP